MNGDLPDGWARVPLDQVLQDGGLFDGPFGSNLKTSDYREAGIRVIRLENLANLRFVEEKRTFISPEKYQALATHAVGAGDILFGSFVDGDVRVCLLPELDTKAIAKADCFCIRPDDRAVDRKYLVYQLAQGRVRDELLDDVHGATRPRITTRQLRQLNVLVCPVPEQRRIVAKLEEVLGKVDECKERLERVPVLLRRFRQSVLAAACSGRLTEDWRGDGAGTIAGLPKQWQERCLRDLSERITKGSTPTSYGHAFQSHGIRFVKVENLKDGGIDTRSIRHYISEAVHRSQARSILRAGDVLFSIAGTIGEVAVVGVDDLPANTNQAVAIIRGTVTYLEPRYLQLVLRAKAAQQAAQAVARGGGMNNISLADVGSLLVPVPARREQQAIIERVASLMAACDEIEARYAMGEGRVASLISSLLAASFRGALVPTEAELARREGRSFEPASVLLERIRMEQASGEKGAARRSRPSTPGRPRKVARA